MSPSATLHRFLFERLGRDLDASFWRYEVGDVDDATLRQACDRGLCRELAGAPVPCRDADCAHDCEVVPISVRRGRVVLPCPHGVRRDREVTVDRATAYQVGAARLVSTFCKSSDVALAFDPSRNAGRRVYPVGTAVWARNALLSLAVGVRRLAVEAEAAAAATLPGKPHVVLLPPTNGWPAFDPLRLREHDIHVFRLDEVVRWDTLELNRYRILAELMDDGGGSVADEDSAALVLELRTLQASWKGHDLGLTRMQFGFLLALAKTPGKPVTHNEITTIAYEAARSDSEPDPGQTKRFKREVVQAFERVATAQGWDVAETRRLIQSRSGVGYVCNETSVRIID